MGIVHDASAGHSELASVSSASPASPARSAAVIVAADGSPSRSWPRALASGARPLRDLADAVHMLCAVHGTHPGLIDHAHDAASGIARLWLDAAIDSFVRERAWLARLTSAVGPMPSTPGQAESEVAVQTQRHAFDMLARSERQGCAIGAAVALVLDWHMVRTVLDTAAIRAGVEPAAHTLPDPAETVAMLVTIAAVPSIERAIGFGAHQVLAQQRGLWDLLESRAVARDAG